MEKLQFEQNEQMKHMLSVCEHFFSGLFGRTLYGIALQCPGCLDALVTLYQISIRLYKPMVSNACRMYYTCISAGHTHSHTQIHIQMMILPWPLCHCHCAQCLLFSVSNTNNLSIDVNITWKIRKGLMNTASFSFSFALFLGRVNLKEEKKT